jgi:ribonuclease R
MEATVTLNDRQLLAHVEKLPHSRATFKQLVRELGARGVNREQLEEALDRLAARGEIIETKSGQFVAASGSREYAVGKLTVHRDGYGFLIPDHRPAGLQGDIFIPPDHAARAMHGDRVIVRIGRFGYDGRAEGEVIKVLERAHVEIVGEFRIKRRGCFVVPHDERIHQWIEIPDGMEVPPPTQNPDRVGVKAVEIKSVEDLEGMIVNVEVLEFPEGDEPGVGRVIEVLGHPDDFGVDVEIMIRKHHLPHQFPPEVLEQARSFTSSIDAAEIERRRDFRDLPIVTIDGETARDFDDAVLVDHLPNGHWMLQVHIADVSHYVTPGTPIDREAFLRGTSVYFPDRAVPMLPVELSTDICSLRPQVDRLVLSALIEMDPKGEVVGHEFCRGVIRSAERMTYTSVHKILEGDAALRERYAPLVQRFELMRDLAVLLNKKRMRRGSIDFDLPEPLIEFDEFGEMTGVKRSPRNIAHRLIEEFMLTANEAVAEDLEQAGIPMIFRIHEKPAANRVLEFEQVAAHFGYSLGVSVTATKHKMVQRRRDGSKVRRDYHQMDEDLPITSKHYQKLVEKIEGKPEERILSYLMLRSLKQARYSERNVGHFALAAPSYTHFTSPIRRYPDLIVHRILSNALDEKQPRFTEEQLRVIGESTSDTERRAAEAERELVEWKKAKFMIDRVGDEFNGLIISTAKFGFFVELEELFIEGLVPIESLRGERFAYQENTRKIIGDRTRRAYSIGDKLRVRLDRVDALEKRLQFSIVEDTPRTRRRH